MGPGLEDSGKTSTSPALKQSLSASRVRAILAGSASRRAAVADRESRVVIPRRHQEHFSIPRDTERSDVVFAELPKRRALPALSV